MDTEGHPIVFRGPDHFCTDWADYRPYHSSCMPTGYLHISRSLFPNTINSPLIVNNSSMVRDGPLNTFSSLDSTSIFMNPTSLPSEMCIPPLFQCRGTD